MQAEIISIGDELLIGQVINTNASWMAEHLNMAGIKVSCILAIADHKEQIMESIKLASKRSDVILLTGGLGPTKDDITKKTLCEFYSDRVCRSGRCNRTRLVFRANRSFVSDSGFGGGNWLLPAVGVVGADFCGRDFALRVEPRL